MSFKEVQLVKDFKDNTRERSDKEVIRRLLTYGKPYKREFFWIVVMMIVSLGIQLLPPLLIGLTVDTVGNDALSRPEKIEFIIFLSIFFIIVLVIGNVVGYLQGIMLQKVGQKTVVSLRDEVFNHIEHLSIGQINQVPVGKLVTRVINDTNTISEMYTNVAVNLIRNVLYLFAILIVIFIINWKISLFVVTVVPLVFLATMIFRKYSRTSYRKVRQNVSEVNAFLSENLSGMKVTQIFNQEDKKRSEFKNHSVKLRNSYLQEILVFGIYRPVVYLFSMVGLLLVLYIGYQEVLAGVITAGILYAYYAYVGDFFEPIQQLAEQFNTLQNAFASAEKVFDVLDTKPEITDDPEAMDMTSFSGRIEFKDVWFSYLPDEWVLKGVSFSVNPGDTVAFVGATGSGKTTILGLIVRNYEIQKGQILIDGIDIKKITRSSLRRFIGQMLQDVFLFSGTILENITLRDESITQEEVKSASEYVGANTFIETLPDSYNHVVLERGNNFSAGQRQLISFARALVYKPSLMILDEATANIDSETEGLIQESLEKMMNISTMLIVAHRLSTIQHADKIIVMQKGEIKESGNHQELLKLGGLYYNLYQLQYEEKEANPA
ncbi:MAG: ABC transporter ATP-binding protein [Tenericutes bacterium GWC2_34_14]|nr:MAG: ABC transporter ATP-binding protein [Tenericutes bacterium GWA2_35_7]OHE28381.1 MAG: ABC transporter ATP-binding protein [Tenericutes bacterium GWC2_34_14]OHE33711.1 MAG: ABC transporter ATP-binding protein [Tenericutes bacterium GWE2_34_108]OHE36996.1 MAG: ABC transporter ATP-binding protein [Tenericutes bacterium GWF1_35_14]OHE37924.1 MAG: ABC transporter ATP-binding protein [Tenericutes bacterium GWF2_35_184]OHE41101.1 MAG: ABC transporter ATP-binding protein [Tenericutes bacterium 